MIEVQKQKNIIRIMLALNNVSNQCELLKNVLHCIELKYHISNLGSKGRAGVKTQINYHEYRE